jgi:hypothetical protein
MEALSQRDPKLSGLKLPDIQPTKVRFARFDVPPVEKALTLNASRPSAKTTSPLKQTPGYSSQGKCALHQQEWFNIERKVAFRLRKSKPSALRLLGCLPLYTFTLQVAISMIVETSENLTFDAVYPKAEVIYYTEIARTKETYTRLMPL